MQIACAKSVSMQLIGYLHMKAASQHPDTHHNLTRKVYQHIRHGLNTGRWEPGDRISGNVLARELGVSRTPVRDAMQQLASEGLVNLRAKSAAHVRDISARDLQDCFGMRRALEPYAAARAAKRITASDLASLGEQCRQMRQLARQIVEARFTDPKLHRCMQQLDAQFHRTILAAAGNRRLLATIEVDRLLTRKVQYPSELSVAHVARTLLEHWRLYRAMRHRDSRGARRAMNRHIATATCVAMRYV